MNRLELIKKTLGKLKELQEAAFYQDIENYLLQKEQETYLLLEIEPEINCVLSGIEIKKYALKAINNNDFLSTTELEVSKKLHTELFNIINSFLNNDYVIVIFNQNTDQHFNSNENELFDLLFKKQFVKNKQGKINVTPIEKCTEYVASGTTHTAKVEHINIGIDLIYKNRLTYSGNNLQGENILFYGHNVEENPYLIELFKNNKPAKLLNIVPLSHRKFYHDNVD